MATLASHSSLFSQLVYAGSEAASATIAALPTTVLPGRAAEATAVCFAALALAATLAQRGSSSQSTTASAATLAASRVSRVAAATELEGARRARVRFVRGELLARARALGAGALQPGGGDADTRRAADVLLDELLSLALPVANARDCEGEWTLAYASRGTVVTRALESVSALTVFDVFQTLSPSADPATMRADNTACVQAGPGVWRLRACGDWEVSEGAPDARVTFTEVALEPVRLFGVQLDGMPALKLSLPVQVRRTATFKTLYMDSRVRVAEGGQSGNRFVLTRQQPPQLRADAAVAPTTP